MPKLWDETIEAHRRGVRDAILDTTAALVASGGLRAVTMSRIAEETGIGRATLYRYFPDVAAILAAWHERQIAEHLGQLVTIRDRGGNAGDRLAAVLTAYAHLSRHSPPGHDRELVAALHHHDRVNQAGHRLHGLIRDILAAGVPTGEVRGDIPADELAGFCLQALGAAGDHPADGAVDRLVTLILAGVRPPRPR